MEKNYIPTSTSKCRVNNIAIPWTAKVKLVAVGNNTNSIHLNKEGVLSRQMAPIYTMPNTAIKKVKLMVVNDDGNILEFIQIYDDDTLEIVQENAIELWNAIQANLTKQNI